MEINLFENNYEWPNRNTASMPFWLSVILASLTNNILPPAQHATSAFKLLYALVHLYIYVSVFMYKFIKTQKCYPVTF